MTLLYAGPPEQIPIWKEKLSQFGPDIDIRFWPDYGRAQDVVMLLVARDIPMDLSLFPNLKAVQTLWAGVDRLLDNPRLAPNLPLARMTDTELSRGMAEFVLYHCLDYLRSGPDLRMAQAQSKWQVPLLKQAQETRVGIMGLGEMGRHALTYLNKVGFLLSGWSASAKRIANVHCYEGLEKLVPFLEECHIVVCLLPLTKETRGILNQDLFSAMQLDSWLIQAGRGDHLQEQDLLNSLEKNRPTRAILDVFSEEPLPAHHPFWRHPKITISPHVAAVTPPGAGAALIIENYRRAQSSQKLLNLVDKHKGY